MHTPVPLIRVLLVAACFTLASAISHQSGLDLLLERQLYHLQGGNGGGFPWRGAWLLHDVMHDGGRALVKRLYFLVLGLYLASFFMRHLKPQRRHLLYILLATLLSTSLVGALKHSTTIPCPYSLQEFGGDAHWVDIWKMFSPDLPRAKCYPAGHASAGYAWLCLAFLLPWRSRSYYLALLPGILLGVSFGLAQQLRGAHFLSHDLLTIGLCWGTSGVLYHVMYRGLRAISASSAAGILANPAAVDDLAANPPGS